MRDSSVQTDDDETNDHVNDDGLENVHVSDVASDAEQKITDNEFTNMKENEQSKMVNKENDDEMSADYAIIGGCESDDGFSCGDSINSDGVVTNGEYSINGGESINSDCSINSDDMAINSDGLAIGDATTGGNGLVNVDDVSNGSVNGGSDEDNFIDISSNEDDRAVVLSKLHTLANFCVYYHKANTVSKWTGCKCYNYCLRGIFRELKNCCLLLRGSVAKIANICNSFCCYLLHWSQS